MIDILILDDDGLTRAILRTMFTRAGYSVVDAADGLQGLQLALQTEPRVIMADLYMPGLDGVAFGERLRAAPCAHPPSLLLMSASPPTHPVDVGQCAMLCKPFDMDALLALIASLVPSPAAARSGQKREA